MIHASEAYGRAIVGSVRRICAKAILDIVDPDIVYTAATASGASPYSRMDQLHNRVFAADNPWVTLERNRWLLNGTKKGLPQNHRAELGEMGWWGEMLSDGDGRYAAPYPWVEQPVTNLSVLQAASVYFPSSSNDGIATDFVFSIYSGSTVAWQQEITGNKNRSVAFEGFTVYNVTALRITIKRWSLPLRRPRALEILPGIYEEWDGENIYTVDVIQETALDNLSVPYGACTLTVYNRNHMFDPYNQSGIFKSIEERQPIPIFYGVALADSSVEYLPLGIYYQRSGGWDINARGMTMTFRLVDIVGLLAGRSFILPASLPETVDGWIALLTAHLGPAFKSRYFVDPALAGLPLTAAATDLKGQTCGAVLRYVCMAVGAFFLADAQTGFLAVRRLPVSGGMIQNLDNMEDYPAPAANDDLADITFRLPDGTAVVYGGTSTAGKSVAVKNPFIADAETARQAARNILRFFGGQKYTVAGRGDMRSELGDVDQIETGFGRTISARRYKQQLKISDGVMRTAPSYYIFSPSMSEYNHCTVLTEDGDIQIPGNVNEVFVILVGGGNGGENGGNGTWDADGVPGKGGSGGKILAVLMPVTPGSVLHGHIGPGGSAGQAGGDTTLGSISSAQGTRYNGYTDIRSGAVYGIPGEDGQPNVTHGFTAPPAPSGYGQGGMGGGGGSRGIRGTDNDGNLYLRRVPSLGEEGGAGGSGRIVTYW